MFAYLRGTVQSKDVTGGAVDRIVLELAGIGLEVAVSHATLLRTGQVGDTVTIHTALVVRETEWTIYGFASPEEKEIFSLLQSVSGVGPKLALAITGTFPPDQIAEAILNEEQKLLSQTPGVGAKVAQRIILELKNKIKEWSERRGVSLADSADGLPPSADEVRLILEELGYTQTEISMVMRQAKTEKPDADVETLVKYSLKVLGAAGR